MRKNNYRFLGFIFLLIGAALAVWIDMYVFKIEIGEYSFIVLNVFIISLIFLDRLIHKKMNTNMIYEYIISFIYGYTFGLTIFKLIQYLS